MTQPAATTPAPAEPTSQPAEPTTATPPVPTPPPSAPTQTQAPTEQQPAEKNFTQADLDRILTERLDRQEKAFTDRLAKAFGVEDPAAVKDPAKLLEASQQETQTYRNLAINSTAEALALAAGIKPERIEMFARLVDLSGALKNVDATDPTAVRTAIKTAVDAKAEGLPEWKGTTLPSSSGGDRQQSPNGKPTYTRQQIEGMSPAELAANADALAEAASEGRIV